MVHADCFISEGLAVLVYSMGLVGLISGLGGVAVGFVSLVHGEISLFCLCKIFSKASVFVWVLALVRIASVATRVRVTVSAPEGVESRLATNLTNENWILAWSIMCGLGLHAFCPFIFGFWVGWKIQS